MIIRIVNNGLLFDVKCWRGVIEVDVLGFFDRIDLSYVCGLEGCWVG